MVNRDGSIDQEVRDVITGHVFTQLSAKEGIEKFGREAELALIRDFTHLHDMSVIDPMKAEKLSQKKKRSALLAITVVKGKHDGTIKAHLCRWKVGARALHKS